MDRHSSAPAPGDFILEDGSTVSYGALTRWANRVANWANKKKKHQNQHRQRRINRWRYGRAHIWQSLGVYQPSGIGLTKVGRTHRTPEQPGDGQGAVSRRLGFDEADHAIIEGELSGAFAKNCSRGVLTPARSRAWIYDGEAGSVPAGRKISRPLVS